MGWVQGLSGAFVNENRHGFPDSLPLRDEITLGVEVLVAMVARGLSTGEAGQEGSSGSNRYRLHDDCLAESRRYIPVGSIGSWVWMMFERFFALEANARGPARGVSCLETQSQKGL